MMSSYKINYEHLRQTSDIVEMLSALERGLEKFGIDYYLVGAVARDVWMSGINNIAPKRTTGDIDFAVLIIAITESLYNTLAGNHIAGQLVRSGTSPALHYGEAQSAESRADFIHKIKIILKELKETKNALRITKKTPLTDKMDIVDKVLVECNELISIFMKSVDTAKKNMETEKKNKIKSKDTE